MIKDGKAFDSNQVLEKLMIKKGETTELNSDPITAFFKTHKKNPDLVNEKELVAETTIRLNKEKKSRKLWYYLPKEPTYINYKTFTKHRD